MIATNVHLAAGSSGTTNRLRDIKPPVEIPNPWLWVWSGLGALVLAGLLFWWWRHSQKQKAEAPPVPVIPPHLRAKQRLREALALIGQPKEFCIAVSDTLRWYSRNASIFTRRSARRKNSCMSFSPAIS